MLTTKIPNWSNIANSVKSIQPILRPTVLLQDHTTDSQISRATTGMRKNSDTANISGTLIWNLPARSNSRKQAVGLRNADNQTTTLNQNGRLRRDCGIEAFICLTTQAQRPSPRDAWIATGARGASSQHRLVRRHVNGLSLAQQNPSLGVRRWRRPSRRRDPARIFGG